jgi:acetyl-CoA synthetase
VRRSPPPAVLERLGLDASSAQRLAARVDGVLALHANATVAEDETRLWLDLRGVLGSDPAWRGNFEVHRRLFSLAFEGRPPASGPAPAWTPSPDDLRNSNVGKLIMERGFRTYGELHRWSVERREEYWATVIRKLGIVFRKEPRRILDPASDPTCPDWLPGAELNIAESCFRADPGKTAILYAAETDAEVRRVTYGDLRALSARVASGMDSLGVRHGERVALYLPMTPEAVGIYLGVIIAGRVVIGIADASASEEFAKRTRIADAKAVFTIDAYVRDKKEHRIYDKVLEAGGPRAVVLPRPGGEAARIARPDDVAWDDFLGGDAFETVPCRPGDETNILFSSGTTKDPKAIPWTHTTPIKGVADAYLHHDVQPSDVLAWPTSFGWMMGPWLTYASLVNRATMALYLGSPTRRDAAEFLEEAEVTILGVVPKIVRSWKADRTMEGLDWSRIRLFSSTGEASTPDEMLYLMSLAGYKPVIEYCGGTEVGGGYVTGTVVQPCAPSMFTTPALGMDFVLLDEGRPADRGEVFLVPPSIGLSNDLLNYDHRKEYFEGLPRGPGGEVLRRHGDQLERLPGGFYRHHGRIDDMINIHGVKTSAEEIRSVIANDLVYDAKPVTVDVDGSGQRVLVVYAVPRDQGQVGSQELRERLIREYCKAIRERLNPLLAHVQDVVLVPELPQAGPGKTRTMRDLQRDYLSRLESSAGRRP